MEDFRAVFHISQLHPGSSHDVFRFFVFQKNGLLLVGWVSKIRLHGLIQSPIYTAPRDHGVVGSFSNGEPRTDIRELRTIALGRYRSGQTGQTVNLLALRLQWFESTPAHTSPPRKLGGYVWQAILRRGGSNTFC